jgi:hypothetical protein
VDTSPLLVPYFWFQSSASLFDCPEYTVLAVERRKRELKNPPIHK